VTKPFNIAIHLVPDLLNPMIKSKQQEGNLEEPENFFEGMILLRGRRMQKSINRRLAKYFRLIVSG
jgi:hypothetical protein